MPNLTRSPRGAVTVARNDCPNPSFEGGLTDGYTVTKWGSSGAAGTLSVQTRAYAYSGTAVLTMKWTTGSAGGAANTDTCGVKIRAANCNPGDVFWVAAAIVSNLYGANAFIMRVRWYSNSGTYLNQDGYQYATSNGSWVRLGANYTAPANAGYFEVWLSFSDQAPAIPTGSQIEFDGVGWGKQPNAGADVPAYFDGSSNSDGTYFYSWEGTPGASSSIKAIADPASTFNPTATVGWQSGRASRNVIHEPGGITAPPVATLKNAGARRGTLALFFGSDVLAAFSAEREFAKAGTWSYVDTALPATSFNFAVDGVVNLRNDETRNRWFVDVPFQELI